MKTYVLTFHGSCNFGAVFQAFALFRAIRKYGVQCEVIDYNRILHHRNFLRFAKGSLKGFLYQLFRWPGKYWLHLRINDFVKRNMVLTRKSYNGSKAMKEGVFPENCRYIVGSDQVWNYEMTGEDLHYFLDFTDSPRKYSYASSFGRDVIPAAEYAAYREFLTKFVKIGVREEFSAEHLRKMGMHGEIVCDPVFLLEREEWSDMARAAKKLPSYVVIFIFWNDPELIAAARKFSEENGCRIINLVYTTVVPGCRNVFFLSPEKWLGLMKNAKAVFTNSFHGFAFSLIFRRNVWCGLTPGGRNGRILDIARRYHVESRILSPQNGFAADEIDYDAVSSRIAEDRKHSLGYLETVLHDGE